MAHLKDALGQAPEARGINLGTFGASRFRV